MIKKLGFLLAGTFFGISLSRSGASDYTLIHQLFTGEYFKIALLMGTAIIVAAIGMFVLILLGNKDVSGNTLNIKRKPLNIYTGIGGALFGIGWAVSGACPGTVLAQIGEGKVFGLFTFFGILFGTHLYARLAENISGL